MRVADYVAKFLVSHGIKDIFVLTGNGAMYLNDGITSESDIKYYCVRNEMTAPLMAESYARINQSLGAVCVTSGPGSTNAASGVAEAWVDSAPILVVSGQVPLRHTTYRAKIPGLRTFGTAEINIVPIVKSITKYAEVVDDPKTIRFHLEKAGYYAMNGRPGPVWLDVPMDVQSAEINEAALYGFTPPREQIDIGRIEKDVDAVIDHLLKSKKPLVVAGNGIRQSGAMTVFKQLLDLLQIPVTFSRLGQDMLPFSHPLNMGLSGIKGSRYCATFMKEADFVLVLGSRLSIPFVGHNFDAFSPSAQIIVVDIDSAELQKPGVKIDLPIKANVKPFIESLVRKAERAQLPHWDDWLKKCQALKQNNPMVTPDMKRNPIDLYYFMSRLDAISTERHIFTTDAGSNNYVGGQVYQFNKSGQREVTSSAFYAMGLSIPLAIGACVAKKDAQILAVTGDGSLELNVQELKTISYYGMNIKLFVINNGGYLSMRKWQDVYFEGRRIGSDDKTGVESLNLRKIADAFDLNYERIDRWEEIDEKLKKITSDNKPLFVEVVCDSEQKLVEPIKDLSF